MPRRVVTTNLVLDHSVLDEPVYAYGAVVLTLRRLAWGSLALLAGGSGILLGLSTEPKLLGLGPLELGPGALLPLPLASLGLALALQPPSAPESGGPAPREAPGAPQEA